MEIAKVFWSGRSQAVRLPKEFRFDEEEFEITAHPASANLGSSSRAIGASTDEKIMRGRFVAPSGVFGCITISAMRRGSGVSRRHAQASA